MNRVGVKITATDLEKVLGLEGDIIGAELDLIKFFVTARPHYETRGCYEAPEYWIRLNPDGIPFLQQ